jgi:ferredoxin--NADP+ reductase
VVDCDTVVFCIGDRVDSSFGLSLDEWKDFAKHPKPHYPIDDISYEAYNPEKADSAEGIFLAGWAREASSGLVGAARKDGERGAKALLQHLENVSPEKSLKSILKDLEEKLNKLDKPIVTKADWEKLTEVELKIAEEQGLESFKFSTNEEMLESMGLAVGNR